MSGWLIHDRDALSEPTRAQEIVCESLAGRFARVECAMLADGDCDALCLRHIGRGYYGDRIVTVKPDGSIGKEKKL